MGGFQNQRLYWHSSLSLWLRDCRWCFVADGRVRLAGGDPGGGFPRLGELVEEGLGLDRLGQGCCTEGPMKSRLIGAVLGALAVEGRRKRASGAKAASRRLWARVVAAHRVVVKIHQHWAGLWPPP